MAMRLRAVGLGLVGLMLAASPALGQTDEPRSLPHLSELADGTIPARFAVAGPVSPDDTRLTLITPDRSCGTFTGDSQQWSAAHVAETETDIVIRVDVATLPDGTGCESDQQVRVPIDLEAPLGDRVIHDDGLPTDKLPLINRIDAVDTGFAYSCGFPSRVVDLLGPGFEVSDRGVTSRIADARAIVDTGDRVVFIGPRKEDGRAESEIWVYRDGSWTDYEEGNCQPEVVLSPGLHAATWTLRGPRPKPGDRRLRINLEGRQCHGKPPAGQVTRPIIQVRKDSIVIILGTYFIPNWIPDGVASGARDNGFTYIDCNGYGPLPMTVRLPVPLGKRTLYDGGLFPPQVRGGEQR